MKKSFLACSILFAASSFQANAGIVSVGYSDFSDTSSFQLNGDAATLTPNADNVLRLTDTMNQSGSAFLKDSIDLLNQASFSSFFSFQITDPVGSMDEDGIGADGLTFTLQTVSNTAGSSGGGLGYSGLEQSLAIEFDTYNNGSYDGDNGNHLGVNINGNMDSLSRVNEERRFNDGDIWNVWVDYSGETDLLSVSYSTDDVRPEFASLDYSVDLTTIFGSDDVFVGFTSGTGGGGGVHDILSFGFNNDFKPIKTTEVTTSVSEPAGILLMSVGLLAVGRVRRKNK